MKFVPLRDEPIGGSYESASYGRVLDDAIEASQCRRIAGDEGRDGSPVEPVTLAIITALVVAVLAFVFMF